MPARRIRFLTINSRWQGFYTKLASEANIKKGSRFLDMLRKSDIGMQLPGEYGQIGPSWSANA